MSADNKVIHFVAGAISGAVGSIVTCPLDVAKTRLQSSLVGTYRSIPSPEFSLHKPTCGHIYQRLRCLSTMTHPTPQQYHGSIGFIKCIKHIINTEGHRALFKGLVPTLIGVVPSRAIYFTAYEHCKKTYSGWFVPSSLLENSFIHLTSAASAGFVCTTITNPIWMIRTRLQLNNNSGASSSTAGCIRSIYLQHGIQGFYKGLVASYFGIIETAIHFVIYEAIKARFIEGNDGKSSAKSGFYGGKAPVDGEEDDVFDLEGDDVKSNVDPSKFLKCMGAGAVSKTIATCIAYPHEVARTRLREENSRYRTFIGTLATVFKEEGYRGLYRGLGTQLVKHIPNTAIVLATYEAAVYLLHENGF